MALGLTHFLRLTTFIFFAEAHAGDCGPAQETAAGDPPKLTAPFRYTDSDHEPTPLEFARALSQGSFPVRPSYDFGAQEPFPFRKIAAVNELLPPEIAQHLKTVAAVLAEGHQKFPLRRREFEIALAEFQKDYLQRTAALYYKWEQLRESGGGDPHTRELSWSFDVGPLGGGGSKYLAMVADTTSPPFAQWWSGASQRIERNRVQDTDRARVTSQLIQRAQHAPTIP